MASKRELIEAHKYNRRRLVTAFVSGTPGGKDVESISRTRPVVAGTVLGALMVAGVLVAGFLMPGPPDDWDQQGVVITESSGERFLALDGTLYPLLNTTSARLALPADNGYRVEVVPDQTVDASPRGPMVGITGAPDDLPRQEQLQQSGWNACLSGGGSTWLTIDQARTLAADDSTGVVLDDGSARHLVMGGVRHEIPPELEVDLLRVLLLDTAPPVEAPGTFIGLYNVGSGLQFPLDRLGGMGEPLPQAFGEPGGATLVGQLVRNVDVGQTPSVLTQAGYAPISEFAAALYGIQAPGALGRAIEVGNDELSGIPSDTGVYVPEDWPRDLPASTSERPCAVLRTAEEGRASTELATVAADHEMFSGPRLSVVPGGGALVQSSSTGSGNSPVYLIDQTGRRFPLSDPSDEVLARLGYVERRPHVVPSEWLGHLGDGVELDAEAALQPVTRARAAEGD